MVSFAYILILIRKPCQQHMEACNFCKKPLNDGPVNERGHIACWNLFLDRYWHRTCVYCGEKQKIAGHGYCTDCGNNASYKNYPNS